MDKKIKIYYVKMNGRLVSLNQTYIEGVHEGYVEIDPKSLKMDPRYIQLSIKSVKKKNA